MKKMIYVLILPMLVISGLVFANREIKNENPKKSNLKPRSAVEKNEVLRNWEASPDGGLYKIWEASPAGKKVFTSEAKIRKSINEFTDMEAVVTSLALPEGSRLGFGLMVRINGEDYILAFGPERSKNDILTFKSDFEQLHRLKVNDKIIIKSHSVSHAPKYAYPIIAGDYVERANKILYKRVINKDRC